MEELDKWMNSLKRNGMYPILLLVLFLSSEIVPDLFPLGLAQFLKNIFD